MQTVGRPQRDRFSRGEPAAGFVGRLRERETLRALLAHRQAAVEVVHLHGPGGIGKSALLAEAAQLAIDVGRPVVAVHGRDVEPSPRSFLAALAWSLGSEERGSSVHDHWPAEAVLLVDDYERLSALDGWLRGSFLPRLPAGTLTLLAGRQRPAAEWRADARWRGRCRDMLLSGLERRECTALLGMLGVAASRQPTLLALGHGHPLVLTLLAEVFGSGEEAPVDLQRHPDLLHDLVTRLVDRVPTPQHRRALAVAAIAHTTNEALLTALLGVEHGSEGFEWLRERSFCERGEAGLRLHEVVREVLDADLQWRDPDGYHELARRVRAHFYQRMRGASPAERPRLQLEAIYALRHDPTKQRFFDWDNVGRAWAEAATPRDAATILEWVLTHEGESSARVAAHWLARQPEAFQVFRSAEGAIRGFMTTLALHHCDTADRQADPAVAAAFACIEGSGGLRRGDEASHVRFWMEKESYQSPSVAVNLTASHSVVEWMTRPALAWSFVTVADANFWRPHFESMGFALCADASFVAGERSFHVFAHDWRQEPAAQWQERYPRPLGATPDGGKPAAAVGSPLAAEPPESYAAAVRHALRHYCRPLQLAASPLADHWGLEGAEAGQVASALRELLDEALASLSEHPRDRKLHRALHAAYFSPAGSLERAAETLDLSFSTFRYRLAKGEQHLVRWLWRRRATRPR